MLPDRESVPLPVLVRLFAVPVITPPNESVVALATSIVPCDEPRVTPRFVPSVIVADVASVPPLMVSWSATALPLGSAPRPASVEIETVPAEIVVLPE